MKNLLLILAFGLLSAFTNQTHSNTSYDLIGITTLNGTKLSTDDLDVLIAHTMDSLNIPGLSIAIINDNQIAYHRTLGVTDLELSNPVTDSTIFEAASLSKPMFAYFIMKMVEKGVIDLDEPYFPILESLMKENISHMIDSSSLDYFKSITPRMTLCHATGIPNWTNGKPIEIKFEPGTGFSYSGEAYQHLAAALGTKLGIGWGSKLDSLFLQEVAHPLNMHSSFFTWNNTIEHHKAKGHQDNMVNREIHRDKMVGPGYSLHSEAHDYALFLIEMMNPTNLKQEYVAEMLKEQNKFKSGNELMALGQTGWGLGFARRPTKYGMRYMHTGNNHDFQAYCAFYPEKKYGLVFFMNCDKIEPFYDVLGRFIDDKF